MIPKKVNKMSLEEQEVFLMGRLKLIYLEEQLYRKALARVRGKVKIEVSDIDRPDLILLKDDKG
jgi:hypothetical protein